MRTLPPGLAEAQRGASATPHVVVTVREHPGSAPRPRWVRVHTGGEAEGPHALAAAGDGALLRLRIEEETLYRQVVTAPAAGQDFSQWTSWRTGTRLCALAVSGAEVRALVVDGATPAQVLESVSTDNGATWSDWSLLETAAGAVECLAAAGKPGGTVLLLYAAGATVFAKKHAGGAWGAASAWSNAAGSVTGLAVAHRGDWNAAITGTEAAGAAPAVWRAVYGDGSSQAAGAWSGLEVITPAAAGAGVVFDAPFLATDGAREWLSYGESYSGPGGYNRPWWSHSTGDFIDALWREPAPFDVTADHGLSLANAAGTLWASKPSGVWLADLTAPALDLSDRVVGLRLEQGPLRERASVTLDNASGRLNHPGEGALAALRLGSELRVEVGYRRQGEAPGVVSGLRLWLEGWEHRLAGDGRRTLTLTCGGAWEALGRTRLRSSRQWAAGERNVFQLAAFLLARAGFGYSTLSASGALTSLQPGFTVHAGQDLGAALGALLEKVEDRLRWDAGAAVGVHPQSGDAAAYPYGEAGHPVAALLLGTAAPEANYVQAPAGAALGEAVDWEALGEVYPRVEVVLDGGLTDEAGADARALAVLRRRALQAPAGVLTARANAGLELYDVVSISEPRLGVSGALRRVMGIRWTYEPGRFQQEIALGPV